MLRCYYILLSMYNVHATYVTIEGNKSRRTHTRSIIKDRDNYRENCVMVT